MTTMTLGEAVEILAFGGWACACTGPRPGDRRCGCQITMAEAHALVRAAHIVARQLMDYAAARETTEMEA